MASYVNRLAQEKSPYLLQHASNPVDWYPWGPEAIEKAKQENKLIFLSVGYSTCHWCHVMEKESFENDEIAKIMNQYFVNIKVDREERPDIDQIYMDFLVKSNGSGGWPMSIWITPELAPIIAGTYFPPDDQWGRPGFKKTLQQIGKKWSVDRDQMIQLGNTIVEKLKENELVGDPISPDSSNIEAKLSQANRIYKRISDDDWGGFSREPKFPEVSKLNFLLHLHSVRADRILFEFVMTTLKKMARGGIHDHVFGGFARYSVDRKWHVPHFEKMLYDQGQLMSVYANAYKATKNEYFLNVADDIVRYIQKDLQHPAGGFYSGEDADSYPKFGDAEKLEGAFYGWTLDEIETLFTENISKISIENAFDIYCHYYSIIKEGNVDVSSDPHGHLLGKNILIVLTTIEETATKHKVNKETVEEVIRLGNSILYEARCKRPRPHLDTKIITSWNGLILSGLSQLACISDAPNQKLYLDAAKKLVDFIKEHLYDESTQTLLRSCYGEGTDKDVITVLDHPISGFLDDYAFLIRGLLDYYLVTLDTDCLKMARGLQETQDRLFWDDKDLGYFYTVDNATDVIIRMKDAHDGAEPSGNSISALNLILLATYFDDVQFTERVKKLFTCFGSTEPFGYILPEMFSGLLVQDRGIPTLIVVGPNTNESLQLINATREYYIPGLAIIFVRLDNIEMVTSDRAKEYTMINDKPTAYFCHNQTCDLPINDVDELRKLLSAKYLLK